MGVLPCPRYGPRKDPEGHEVPREKAVPGHSKTLGVKGTSDSGEGCGVPTRLLCVVAPHPLPFLVKQDSCVGVASQAFFFLQVAQCDSFFFKVYNAVIYLTPAHSVE